MLRILADDHYAAVSFDNLALLTDFFHGVGHEVHEAPDVPNYGTPGRGPRLCAGLVIAIEPMVNVGTYEVKELDDGWTVKTKDRKLSAHYENTVALTDNGLLLLTEVERENFFPR